MDAENAHVTIGRRLINLARGELNSLLDRASELGGDDHDDQVQGDADSAPRGNPADLSSLSDAELTAEIERRRRAKERGEAPKSPPRAESAPPPRPSGPVNEVARAYAALEVPAGSDFATVRKAYRTMMRKYHPDRHTATPDKQKAANEVAQRLTEAYKLLEKRLR